MTDNDSGISSHDLYDIPVREHEPESPEFLGEGVLRKKGGVRTISINDASFPEQARIHRPLARAGDCLEWKWIQIPESWLVVEAGSHANALVVLSKCGNEDPQR